MVRIKQVIKNLLSDSRKLLKIYATGAVCFFIGLGLIFGIAKAMPASLEQELIVLAGLVIGGTGFSLSMLAQCGLVVFRIRHMGEKK